ncbi:MAG: fibrobacter succinogenes major paralogous domain-containing protein [Fibrobacter intestinalis]|uniref:fibrobacter succinogenes major paralogous domain-containing protein n=1 Tax=Fibrobacter intestinalis TaxID=28122 RepID=UPI003F0EFAB5
MHIKRYLFTAFALFTLVGLASAEQVCTESEYKGRTIKKCRDTGSSGGDSSMDSFTDPRDGQTYKTVQIGNQTWMAENLNYETDDSYCYEDKKFFCHKFGRLYTWNAAMQACPAGWHLPSDNELKTLFETVGGEYREEETIGFLNTNVTLRYYTDAGKKLKSTRGWDDSEGKSGNGTDEYGFSVLPAGARGSMGDYGVAGETALFWGLSVLYDHIAYRWGFSNEHEDVYLDGGPKIAGYSVRCLRDSD